MRLIDADKLMKYALNQKSKTVGCNDIARFPTAFDVDKFFYVFGCMFFSELNHTIGEIKFVFDEIAKQLKKGGAR